MSTRGQIKVVGSDVMIYKHSDSYPEGVMPTLKDIVSTFADERGNDPAYALAQIMRAYARRDEEERQAILADDEQEGWNSIYEEPHMTGWGLDCVQHGDIEYLYEVDLAERTITIKDIWEGTEEVVKV